MGVVRSKWIVRRGFGLHLLSQFYIILIELGIALIFCNSIKMVNPKIFAILVLLQLTLLTQYYLYLTPKPLQTSCITATAKSQAMGQSNIIDCVACLTLNHDQMELTESHGKLVGIVPLKKTPIDRLHDGNLKQSGTNQQGLVEVAEQVFFQYECVPFECSTVVNNPEMDMNNADGRKWLKNNRFLPQDAEQSSEISINNLSLFERLMIQGNSTLDPRYTSSSITASSSVETQHSTGIMWRLRYIVSDEVDGTLEPLLVFHHLSTSFFIRLLLVAPLLLQVGLWLKFLSHFTPPINYLIYIKLGLLFLSPYGWIASAILTNLILSKRFTSPKTGIMCGVSVFFINFIINNYSISNLYLLLMMIIVTILITIKAYTQKQSNWLIMFSIFIQINSIYAWAINFPYLLKIVPLHCLILVFYGEQLSSINSQTYKKISIYSADDEDAFSSQRTSSITMK